MSLKINRLLPIYISIVPLKFGVDLHSQTKVRVRKKIQYGCLAAILKLTLLKINRFLHIYISIVPLKFGVDIQSQTKVRVWKPKKSNMATRQPFWKWCCWKSISFCLWPPSTCIWSLKLKFQSKLDLHSGNHVTYRVQKPKSLIWPPGGHFENDVAENQKAPTHIHEYCAPVVWSWYSKPKQSWSLETKKSNMAARRPFWNWRRWKSIGFCLWPPSTCIWNLKLKFQSKLDLCSGNHVVYRQTDGRTDRRTDGRTRWIQYTPLQLRWAGV